MTTASLEQAMQNTVGARYRLAGVLEAESRRTVFRAVALPDSPNPADAAIIVDTSEQGSANFKKYLEASFLDHPNLIRIFDIGWLEAGPARFPYLVTEVPDTTLEEVAHQSPLSATELAELRRQIVAGLTQLHSENLAYGELCESKVWRVRNHWKLSDYSGLQVAALPGIGVQSLQRMLRRIEGDVHSPATRAVRKRTKTPQLVGVLAALLVVVCAIALSRWPVYRPSGRSASEAPVGSPPKVADAGKIADASIGSAAPVETRSASRVVPRSDTKAQIAALLGRWAQAVRIRSATDQMACYAPLVDPYFGRHRVPAAELYANKLRVFEQIGPVERFTIAAFRYERIGPDQAVVSFDKSWRFGGRRPFWGAAREQMTLRNYNGVWKIASEQEIKVYSTGKARPDE